MEGPKGEYWNRASHVVLGNRKAVSDLTQHYNLQRVWLLSFGWWGGQLSTALVLAVLQLAGVGLGWSLFLAVLASSIGHAVARGILAYRFSQGWRMPTPRGRPAWMGGHQPSETGARPKPPRGGPAVQPSAETRARIAALNAQARESEANAKAIEEGHALHQRRTL
jgi:hypothetical protein